MPKEILIIFVLLIMFLAGPPVAVYMFNLANDPIASHYMVLIGAFIPAPRRSEPRLCYFVSIFSCQKFPSRSRVLIMFPFVTSK